MEDRNSCSTGHGNGCCAIWDENDISLSRYLCLPLISPPHPSNTPPPYPSSSFFPSSPHPFSFSLLHSSSRFASLFFSLLFIFSSNFFGFHSSLLLFCSNLSISSMIFGIVLFQKGTFDRASALPAGQLIVPGDKPPQRLYLHEGWR